MSGRALGGTKSSLLPKSTPSSVTPLSGEKTIKLYLPSPQKTVVQKSVPPHPQSLMMTQFEGSITTSSGERWGRKAGGRVRTAQPVVLCCSAKNTMTSWDELEKHSFC